MGILSNDDGLKFKDTITKQDLVEYAITKKVEELTVLKDEVYKQYKAKSKKREDVKNQIEQAKKDAELSHIQDNYGDVIKLLEMKKGTKHEIISSKSDFKSRGSVGYMIAQSLTDNILIVIPNKESKNSSLGGGLRGMHPMYPDEMAAYLLSTMGTVITVSRGDIKSDVIDSLKSKFDELDKECKSLDKEKKSYEDKIYKVKTQKDTIKANIIEQALIGSKDGVKMLQSLQNIDFGIGDIKLITTKKSK